MLKFAGLIAASALAVISLTPIKAQQAPDGPEYTTPLGSAMEEYPYPYPVEFLPLNIEGEDVRMAYMDVKPASGEATQTVLLLHGKNFYGSYWGDTAKVLSEAGYRVVIPDQIGFGKSSKPDIDYSFDLLATNTITLLNKLEIDEFTVVGHSMGGMLAARIALNYKDRVTHLVLENPIGLEDYRFNVPPLPTEQVYQGELNNTDTQKIRNFISNYVVEWKPEVFEPFVEVRKRITLGGEYPRWAKAAALTYQMIYRQPVVHEFPNIKAPTLLVIGQKDRTTLGRGFVPPDVIATMGNYPELGKKTARAIPDSQLVEIDNADHIPHLETSEVFHKALLKVLRGEDVGIKMQ